MNIKFAIIELRGVVFQIKRPVSILILQINFLGLSYSIYGFGWIGYLLYCVKNE